MHAPRPVPRTRRRRALWIYVGPRNFFHPQVTYGHMNTSVAIGLLPNISIRLTVAFYGSLSESADARRANHDSYTYKPVHGHLPYDDRSRICAENPGGTCAYRMRSAHRQVRARGKDVRDITGAGGRWHAHLAKSGLCPCFTTALCRRMSRYLARKSAAVVRSAGVLP